MKKINIDNKIFLSPEFQKDKYKFYLVTLNLSNESVMLYSDEENYVLCRGEEGLPVWLWTKDGMEVSKIDEIINCMMKYLTNNEKVQFTCKKEIYDLLVNSKTSKFNLDDYFEMGFLLCEKTVKPKHCDGHIAVPTNDDKLVLVKYWYDDCKEMVPNSTITMERAENEVQKMIDSNNFYLWKNDNGKIVCMVTYSVIEGQAKLSHVYTPREERRKGYASNLIYTVTNDLLDNGLVPLLYTDYNYIPSNRTYINVGYKDEGILINFNVQKN